MPGLKRPFGATPFWFWNDAMTRESVEEGVARMDACGVGGFVIHPRMGLPKSLGWMSPALLDLMAAACREARRRGLRVILYDEGMYPSGSSCGQVVAENPAFACRGLEARTRPDASPGENVVASCPGLWIVDRPVCSTIRGLHYLDEEETQEHFPPAADILNPDAVACFLRLVHDRYDEALGEFFGSPITAVFTDEPSLLGRGAPPDCLPGTTDIFDHALRLTGIEFRDRLKELFFDPGSEARRQWSLAAKLRLEETYYAPMAAWLRRRGLDLMGHPEGPGDLGALRYFSIPGQDLVWRWVLPGPSATQGPQSTTAKAASSAGAILTRGRNSTEFAGAYGHDLTFEELRWLGDWSLVRGQDWLIPHAFYSSLRGPRRDERPPDVGWHAPWADRLPELNAYWERMSRLVSQSSQGIRVGVLASSFSCPWEAAETLYQNQIDFAYLEDSLLDQGIARIYGGRIYAGSLECEVLVCDGEGDPGPFAAAGAQVVDARQPGWLEAVERLAGRTLELDRPCPSLRVRLVEGGALAFNEGEEEISFRPRGMAAAQDAWSLAPLPVNPLVLLPFQTVRLYTDSGLRNEDSRWPES